MKHSGQILYEFSETASTFTSALLVRISNIGLNTD
jgi:hypothetical protein